MCNAKIVLASASPRRVDMLSWITDAFVCLPPEIDETPEKGERPLPYCERIARTKALRTAARQDVQGAVILAADTTVYLDEQILGKPADAADAKRMLTLLNGTTHHVCTSVVLCNAAGTASEILQTTCVTAVQMNRLSEATLDAYVASGDPLGKAGAYGIQNTSFDLVASLDGCYASVMGFPLCHLSHLMTLNGTPFEADTAARCKAHIQARCEINIALMLYKATVKQEKVAKEL